MQYKKLIVVSIFLAVLFLGVIGAAAQTGSQPASPQGILHNAFTYQGYVTDETGAPLNDLCDIRFSLWDAASGGNQIGTNDDNNANVQIANGYFTASVNDGNEFGSTSFNGDERYLSISLTCTDFQETLSPRQRLSPAPYAIYAMNIPDHDHLGEWWQGAASPAALTLINDGVAGVGLVVAGPGGDTGRAIAATGGIYSTADTVLYLNPQTMVARIDSLATSIGAYNGGTAIIYLPADTSTKYVMVPMNAYGELLGTTMYVKSLRVCYLADDDGSDNYISYTGVYKNGGTSISDTVMFLNDATDYSNDQALECYTLTAPTPRVAIDNTSWVQFSVSNTNAMASQIYITTVEVTLTQVSE